MKDLELHITIMKVPRPPFSIYNVQLSVRTNATYFT